MLKIILNNLLTIASMVVNIIMYFLSGFSKRKKNRVILGAWGGDKISDNPRYVLEYLKEQPNLELIWCGKLGVKDSELLKHNNITFVKYNSLKSFYYCLTSKYVFFSGSYRDISLLNLFKGATVVQLWHGFGLKKTSAIKKDIPWTKKLYYKVGSKTYEKCDYFISSSELNTNKILNTFKYNDIKREKVIPSGQPKNDYLISNRESHQKLRRDFTNKYKIPEDKKIILYLPTFRDKDIAFSFNCLDGKERKEITRVLEANNAVLVEKMHYKNRANKSFKLETKNIYTLNSEEETQQLLLISDILITDYSSCYLDFLLLDKPLIHFAYDYHQYKDSDRGLYYDLDFLAAGPIAYDLTALLAELGRAISNPEYYKEKRVEIKNKAMTYDTGESCKKITRQILGKG